LLRPICLYDTAIDESILLLSSMSKTVEFLTSTFSMVEPPNHEHSSSHDDRLSASLDAKGNGFRRRALSLAETQPSVETVIVKAKRAAQSLWMLLHAQVRTPSQSLQVEDPATKSFSDFS